MNFNRMPPANIDAEIFIIGNLMIDDDAYSAILGECKADWFFKNKTYFEVAMKLGEEGAPININTVSKRLKEDNKYSSSDEIHLADIIKSTPFTMVNLNWYINELRKAYIRRQLVVAASNIEQLAFDASLDTEERLSKSYSELIAVSELTEEKEKVKSIQEVLEAGLEEEISTMDTTEKNRRFIPSGIGPLDYMITGFMKGGMTTVSAPTGLGKSLFVQDRIIDLAHRGYESLVFSTEMADEDVVSRMLYMQSELDEHHVRITRDSYDIGTLALAVNDLRHLPIRFKDSGNITIEELESTVYQEMKKKPVDIIVVDHFHELSTGTLYGRDDLKIESIARALQRIARVHDIPVIVVMQQSRGEHEGNLNASLKGSSSLEQKAAVTLFLRPVEALKGKDQLTPDEARERARTPSWMRVRMTAAKVRKGGMTGSQDLCLDWRRGGKFFPWQSWAEENREQIELERDEQLRNSLL